MHFLLSVSHVAGAGDDELLWKLLLAQGTVAGGLGSIIDSLLGAVLQFSGTLSPSKKKDAEVPVVVNAPSRGVKKVAGAGMDMLSNDAVNFITVCSS